MRRSRRGLGRGFRNYSSSSSSSDDDTDDEIIHRPPPPKRQRLQEVFHLEDVSDSDDEPPKETSPVPPIVAKGLGLRLHEKMLAEEDVDVDVLIGPQRRLVKAHKLVLAGGLSDVLITQLNAPLWKISEKDGKVIEFPEDISEEAAMIFIKFLYVEELSSPELSTQILLELMSMADLYMVGCLLNWCDNSLSSRMTVSNCIDIYQRARRFGAVTAVGCKAYDFAKENIEQIIDAFEEDEDCPWDELTWEALLKEDYLLIEEIKLFKLLLKWKDKNVSDRGEKFEEIVYLIRFPLMERIQFVKYVVPSRALGDEDIISVFMHFDNGETTVYQDAARRFNSKKRRTRSVKNSEELNFALEKCIQGDTILIAEGLYEGNFSLQKNQVKIIGASNLKTIFKGSRAINIEGDECTLENITTTTSSHRDMCDYSESSTVVVKPSSVVVIGDENVVKNLRIEVDPALPSSSEDHGLVVIGESNSFTNIYVEKHHTGILINGQENKLFEVTIEECQVGLMIPQTRNEMNNLTLKNTRHGLDLYGFGNKVHNVAFNFTRQEEGSSSSSSEDIKAINMTGRGHNLENLVCTGLEAFPSKSWSIYMSACTSAATIYNCGPGQVFVKGHKNYLENVDAAGMLKIFGRSHEFVNCSADNLVNNSDELPQTKFSKCKFGTS